jgi:hypothetical protein
MESQELLEHLQFHRQPLRQIIVLEREVVVAQLLQQEQY